MNGIVIRKLHMHLFCLPLSQVVSQSNLVHSILKEIESHILWCVVEKILLQQELDCLITRGARGILVVNIKCQMYSIEQSHRHIGMADIHIHTLA